MKNKKNKFLTNLNGSIHMFKVLAKEYGTVDIKEVIAELQATRKDYLQEKRQK
ncbi:MAG: hypothetical protein LBF00_03140 [Mycoplasmataceae bacterium]|jgi:hypothetical protein|nr:hypothetical protein [Mycoplasmataceae bacterium]